MKTNEDKYMTSIQIDVFNSNWINTTGKPVDKIKVYYDCVEVSTDQIKAIVKMTKILSRWVYSIDDEEIKLDDLNLSKLNVNPLTKKQNDK